MKSSITSTLAVTAALSLSAISANAATLIVDQDPVFAVEYDFSIWQSISSGPNVVGVETFEDRSTLTFNRAADNNRNTGITGDADTENRNYGEIVAGESITSNQVGSFTTYKTETGATGVGTGSTCDNLSGSDNGNSTCENIALQYDPPQLNGQGNITPDDGSFAINSADTYGITWNAAAAGNATFSSLYFALRDPGDQNPRLFSISGTYADDTTFSRLLDPTNGGPTGGPEGNGGFGNNATQLFGINLGEAVTSASLSIFKQDTNGNFRINDAFTIDGVVLRSDGVRVDNPPPVPLPAAGWMLLAGVGGIAAMKRRKKADA